MHQHTCIFSPDSDVSHFFFRLSFSSFAFSFRTAPPSGLLSPCPWSGPAVWLVSWCTKINTSESHVLVWITLLVRLDVLMVPAVELGLLQGDVRVRIQLASFLHVSFSFLCGALADIQIDSFWALNFFSVRRSHLRLVFWPDFVPSFEGSVNSSTSSCGGGGDI